QQVAQAIREDGLTASVYDPHWQAGLTIAPWVTIESRLALLSCLISSEHHYTVYKLLLFIMWLSLPATLWFMCRTCNLGSGAISGALLLFLGAAWSPWGLQLLRHGECDVIIGTASMGLALSMMVRSYARPRWWTLPGWLFGSAVALYFWPPIMLLLLICFIVFLGILAGRLPWSRFLGLIAAYILAILLNACWIHDCWLTWWLLADRELLVTTSLQEYFSIKANLQLMVWPGLLLVIGFLGTRTLKPGIGGRSALVWSLAIVLTTAAALLPQEIESLHLDKLHGWWWCSVWLATIPVGKLLAFFMECQSKWLGSHQRNVIVITVLTATLGGLFRAELEDFLQRIWNRKPLQLQGTEDLQQAILALRQQTTSEARILWEETRENAAWSPLLLNDLERNFVGGLGRAEQVLIEPLQVRLASGNLLGKPIEHWSLNDLHSLVNDWNIGWVAAFHPETIQRWLRYPDSEVVAALPGTGQLIKLKRYGQYCKQGYVRWQTQTRRQIVFTDLMPENGHIVLSLHHHLGMRLLNSKARIETWQQSFDGIPMIKIKIPEPMERLTITW
ncbi:MAG TPA: hypothetical protein PKA06_05880, partial [Gemmatales bacterium]|nr:hypothetical protein [Gemmatales bacterium]